MFDQQPELVGQLTRELMELLADGRLQAPPRREFPLADAVAGFRFMAQAKHIGKVVLTMPAVPNAASNAGITANATGATRDSKPIEIRGDATYLITGGLGGLGRRIAEWLVDRGARHLVLVGRRPPNESAAMQIAALQQRGVRVRACQVDAANLAEIKALVTEINASAAPLAGVIHAAGVLDDGVLVGQTAERFARVFAPKVAGAWNLDQATQSSSLDFFVLFSSLAAWLGSAGQANYAAANSLLDALAADRHARGLPATSIAWGPWAEAGMAAGLGEAGKRRFAAAGIELIPPQDGLAALGRLLDQPEADVAVLPVDWAKFFSHSAPGEEPAMLRELAASSRASAARRDRGAVSQTASATATREAASPTIGSAAAATSPREGWHAAILAAATRVLGTDTGKQLASDQPLTEQGLDSLLAIELVGALRKLTGRNLPAALVFDYPTVDALAAFLAATEPASATPVRQAPAKEPTMAPTAAPSRTAQPATPLAATIAAATSPNDSLGLVTRETAKVLGLDAGGAIDTARPLVDMGLDSLLAIELVGALRKATGRGLPATLVFDHPTIDALAAHLAATAPATSAPAAASSAPPSERVATPAASTSSAANAIAVAERVTVAAPAVGASHDRAWWRQLIAHEAGKVLGVDGQHALAADQPLTEQGLDSLLAIELVGALRKASGRSLPATLVFDHPTLNDLSEFLAATPLGASATNGAAQHALNTAPAAMPASAPTLSSASAVGSTITAAAPAAGASRTPAEPGEFDFVVEDLRPWHADELPELHIKAFPGYFLTLMGHGFLKRFYAEFCLHPYSYGCVARSKRTGKLVAVATGSANVPAHFKHFYRSHAPYLAMCIATKSITNGEARRAVLARTSHAMHALRMLIPGMRPPAATAAVSDKDPPNQCPVRFLSMGIDPKWRSSKASIETTLRFEEIVRAAGHPRYGCSILANNERAIGFFTGMGFELTFRSSKGCWFEKDL